ncbi:MAG: hypothetical protein ACJ05G_08145 [Actinomycetota bacterium]|nr:hypothetical protein [Acidimicrobiales bacterium]
MKSIYIVKVLPSLMSEFCGGILSMSSFLELYLKSAAVNASTILCDVVIV